MDTLKKDIVKNSDKFTLYADRILEGVKLATNIVVPVISLIAALTKLKR